MRGGHEGPGVLHLHAGAPLEDEGGPRARVCVSGRRASRTCRVWRSRRRFCSRRPRRTIWTIRSGIGVVQVQAVRARLPRRRAMCARLGVLEDVLGPAGDGLAFEARRSAMHLLGNGLPRGTETPEDALSVRRGPTHELSTDAARWSNRRKHSLAQNESCERRMPSASWTVNAEEALRLEQARMLVLDNRIFEATTGEEDGDSLHELQMATTPAR